ncbi:MAG TPA: hypothetical protein VIU34_10650 [Steroidobacter sp.]
MLLDEPPEDPPPPLEPPEDPDEPPDEPEEPPLGMLDGIDDEEDCCWGQPPIKKAETELTSTHWIASVSRRLDASDELGPVMAVIRVG